MTTLVKRNAKAIAGFMVAAGAAWLAKHGLNLDPEVETVGIGLLTGAIVWLVRNSGGAR